MNCAPLGPHQDSDAGIWSHCDDLAKCGTLRVAWPQRASCAQRRRLHLGLCRARSWAVKRPCGARSPQLGLLMSRRGGDRPLSGWRPGCVRDTPSVCWWSWASPQPQPAEARAAPSANYPPSRGFSPATGTEGASLLIGAFLITFRLRLGSTLRTGAETQGKHQCPSGMLPRQQVK